MVVAYVLVTQGSNSLSRVQSFEEDESSHCFVILGFCDVNEFICMLWSVFQGLVYWFLHVLIGFEKGCLLYLDLTVFQSIV